MTANLSRMLTRQRLRRPDQPAVIESDTSKVTTFAELDGRVHAVAAGLREQGVGPGSLVGILAPNRIEFVLTLFAVARLGGVTVPLNVRLHPEELAYVADHAGITTLVVDGGLAEAGEALARRAAGVERQVGIGDGLPEGWWSFAELEDRGGGQQVPDAHVGLDDPQRVLYTSGTTSRPKGVTITHGNAVFNHLAQITELELTAADRFLVSAPLYHVAAIDGPGLTCLYLGGAIVLTPDFHPQTMLRATIEHRVTGMILPHPVILGMIDEPPDPTELTEHVRWVIFAGLAPSEIERLRTRVFPTARMVESLGMTEYTSGIAYLDARNERAKAGSAGVTVHHADLRVVDETGVERPAGEVGEFVARGPKVTTGYWREPERNREAFDNGWLRTGDMGYIDEDGYAWFVDRKKHMIRSGGENIAAAEVERVLLEHPAVVEAAVIPTPHPTWGEVPKAVVVASGPEHPTADELVEHCRSMLARFKCPKAVSFVEQLPRNHSGKVLKNELAQREREQTEGSP